MYEYFTDGIFTVCKFTPDNGPFFEAQVITSEYESEEVANASAKKIADDSFQRFIKE